MKKIYAFIAAVVVLAAASVAVIVNAADSDLLFVANVEALVQVEAGVFECVKVITSDPDEMCFYCGTCGELPGRGKKESYCYKQ